MENYDLDINNYNLEDILQLFKLPYNFTEQDLKKSYRRALKFHPDKSNLNIEYYYFFMKAYKVVARIYYFRERKKECVHEVTYMVDEMGDDQKEILKKIDKKKFNNWFNKMFEKLKIQDKQQDSGYEEWFRSNKDIFDSSNVSKEQIDNEFERRKAECRSLIIRKDIINSERNIGYDLLREKPEEYSAELFSKLPYEDLKKAHIETVIPVTKEDYDKIKKFSDIESYKMYRDKVMPEAPSLKQSKQLLARKKQEMIQTEAHRAYEIMKQDELIEKSNEKWWGFMKHLTDG